MMVSESNFKFINPLEEILIHFPKELQNLGPSHPAWSKRVAVEIRNIMQYIDFLKSRHSMLWFFLKPSELKQYNFQRWDGFLKIPTRSEIVFEIRIILTNDYPQVFPRAFAESSIMNYCAGNIYPTNIWRDAELSNSKEFVMICHDHMKKVDEAWNPDLSLAHFFLNEVWYWWMAKMNRIIYEWDEQHYDKN